MPRRTYNFIIIDLDLFVLSLQSKKLFQFLRVLIKIFRQILCSSPAPNFAPLILLYHFLLFLFELQREIFFHKQIFNFFIDLYLLRFHESEIRLIKLFSNIFLALICFIFQDIKSQKFIELLKKIQMKKQKMINFIPQCYNILRYLFISIEQLD